MPSRDSAEDIVFFLYLVPIVASIIYGVYEWAVTAKSSTMPPTAYLIVSKSPELFILALVAICGAIIIDVHSASLSERNAVIQTNTLRLQVLAVAVLVISFAAALSTADYNFGNAASFFVNGRYALIFAFFLIGLSILLIPKQVFGNIRLTSVPELVGLILLVAAPVIFYGGLKVHLSFAASAGGALIVAILGIFLLFAGPSLFGKKQPKTAEPPKVSPA
jgi:hypothetical protein